MPGWSCPIAQPETPAAVTPFPRRGTAKTPGWSTTTIRGSFHFGRVRTIDIYLNARLDASRLGGDANGPAAPARVAHRDPDHRRVRRFPPRESFRSRMRTQSGLASGRSSGRGGRIPPRPSLRGLLRFGAMPPQRPDGPERRELGRDNHRANSVPPPASVTGATSQYESRRYQPSNQSSILPVDLAVGNLRRLDETASQLLAHPGRRRPAPAGFGFSGSVSVTWTLNINAGVPMY